MVIVVAVLAAPVVVLATLPVITAALTEMITHAIASLSPPLVIVLAVEAAVLLLVAIWWLWWRLPRRQLHKLDIQIHDPKARADTEDNFRKTVGQALGGAAVLIGVVAAYLQFTQQQQASRDLLISNQVAKSFEQLGSAEIATRLGGIYGLEGVMNAPGGQYHQAVLEALCAFVRESTSPRQTTLATWFRALVLAAKQEARRRNGPPATDVQAALTVIGRRNVEHELMATTAVTSPVNLKGADIRGAALREAHLERASLFEAHLEGSVPWRAHLEGADLSLAYLERANLFEAHLEGADLTLTHLDGAFLRRAHLEGADLSKSIGLEQAQIDAAYGDAGTKLPDGLTRPAHWTDPTAPRPQAP